MRKTVRIGAAAAVTLLASVAAIPPGGWAVVSIDNIPESVAAGRPLVLDFRIRQHGVDLLKGLEPTISASSGQSTVSGSVRETPTGGVYRGTITLPNPGDWSIAIETGFGESRLKLLPLAVIPATQRIAAMSAYERGRQFFAAKGCVTCHAHRSVGAPMLKDVGPDLTDKRFAADYLERFLADPSIEPAAPNAMRMPNLGLRKNEIANLVTFINSEP